MATTIVNHYAVRGMTSQHKVDAVADEFEQLPGVLSVAIDPDLGGLTVASNGGLTRDEINAALRSAGCEVDL